MKKAGRTAATEGGICQRQKILLVPFFLRSRGQTIAWFVVVAVAGVVGYRLLMPRKLRVEYPGAMYHVMSRGDRREDIFLNEVEPAGFH